MRVLIIGCGYVGLSLTEQLVEAGDDVVGVRRSRAGIAAVETAGGTGVRADLTDPAIFEQLPEADALVFAASTGRGSVETAKAVWQEGFPTAIEQVAEHSPGLEQVIFTSSTGVYGDQGGAWVDEDTPIDPETKKLGILAEAERRGAEIAATHGLDLTIARFAGIYGPSRYRVESYLTKPSPPGYRNIIHRDDAAGTIAFLLTETAQPPELLLVADNEPVHRWDFVTWLAEQVGVDPPPTQTIEELIADDVRSAGAIRRLRSDKRIDNSRLRKLGYEFLFPTFREGYQPAIASYKQAGTD